MRKFLFVMFWFIIALMTNIAVAQDFPRFPPRYPIYYPQFYPYPIVYWGSYGTNMVVGPVFISPDRRYVNFGINVGFSQYNGFSTFNYSTGETKFYPNRPLYNR